jgi:hypothetical protein
MPSEAVPRLRHRVAGRDPHPGFAWHASRFGSIQCRGRHRTTRSFTGASTRSPTRSPISPSGRDAAQLQLKKARDTLAAPIDSLRDLMSRWQDSTYKGYDSIVDRLNNVVGRQPIPDTTGADGSVTIRLPNGDWWVYARSWVADDPNAEWYWNVPIRSGKIVLDRTTGKRQPRY